MSVELVKLNEITSPSYTKTTFKTNANNLQIQDQTVGDSVKQNPSKTDRNGL